MGRDYQDLDRVHGFDYDLWAPCGAECGEFRGPPIDLHKPFLAFVGSEPSFGRFVAKPFSTLLGEKLALPVLNLSIGGAGPGHFDQPHFVDALNRAEAIVVQVLSRRSEYMPDFHRLLGKLTPPRILFWFSNHEPGAETGPEFPPMVDKAMVAELAAQCDAYVECVSNEGPPQRFSASDEPNNDPSAEMHARAADRLETTVRRAVGRPRAEARTAQRFVIVATERTGTNLLIGLLRTHPQCFCAGELFNPDEIQHDRLAWKDLSPGDAAHLVARRRVDPLGFLGELYDRSHAAGYRATGFKLMYAHGLESRPLLDALIAGPTLKVIHVTRRNLLRRAVSDAQARATDVWGVARGDDMPKFPSVDIDPWPLVDTYIQIEDRQALYAQMFDRHDVLHVIYEDLASRPEAVAARAADFLGLPPYETPPSPTWRKTGSDSLSDVVQDVDKLRARFRRWAAFFDQ